jgi:hypothetical protein
MDPYEYSLIQMSAGTRVTMFNERLDHAVQEGWEPFLMSGDTTVTVLMRRPREGAAARQPQAAAAAVAPRPAPVAQIPAAAPQPVAVAAGSGAGALNQQ